MRQGRAMSPALELLQDYAPIVSVAGALILFFSWVTNNGFQTKFAGLKSRIEQADRDSRISSGLADIRGELGSIVSEVLKPRSPRESDAIPAEVQYWDALDSMAQTRLNA